MTQWDDQSQTRRMPASQQDPQGQAPYGQPPGYGQVPPDPRPGVYGQQTYGRNEYGQPANPFGAAGDHTFGIAGMVTALLGGIAVLVSFTAIDWFTANVSFGDLHDRTGSSNGFTGFGNAYFGWLAWAFLILGVLTAVLSSFPSPAVRAVRAIGVVVGVAAAGLTFLAIKPAGTGSYSSVLGDARVGFYLAVLGFALIAIGAGIGPRHVSTVGPRRV